MKNSYYKFYLPLIMALCIGGLPLGAQTLTETAEEKITIFKSLITQAEETNLTARREEMAVNTAEVFLKYEDNIAINTDHYKAQPYYRNEAVNGTKAYDLITQNEVSITPNLAPFEVYYVELKDEKSNYFNRR